MRLCDLLPLTHPFALRQHSVDVDSQDLKKPRRSQRISSQQQMPLETPVNHDYLPTPLTHGNSTATDIRNEVTATPPDTPNHNSRQQTPANDYSQAYSSPPGDTQALSQFIYPPRSYADEVADESTEGVWGYLVPLDDSVSGTVVLKHRDGCAGRDEPANDKSKKSDSRKQGNKRVPGGYLIGRHPECGS